MIGLSLLLLLFIGNLSAQATREIYLAEDFSSGTFPPAGWSIDSNAANWGAYAAANAGGSVPELRFAWSPRFNGSTYFISPALDTSGESTLLLDFRQFVDHYQSGYTVGLATRSAQGAWNTAWSLSPSSNLGPEQKTVTINNADVGATDFQFAFFFSGDTYNINFWFLDNVKLYSLFPYDLALTASTLPVHAEAGSSVTPACTVKNMGMNPLTAMVSLNVYCNGELVAQNPDYFISYLSPGATQTATAPVFTPSLPNKLYSFNFSVSSLEDVVDNNLSDNLLIAHVNTWAGARQMVVLEIATGGWCPYCPGAAIMADDFVAQGYNVAVIENHNGDPYANDSSNSRNNYYGVSGYPTGIFDGVLKQTGGQASVVYPPLYQQRSQVKTPLNISIFGVEADSPTNYDVTIRLDKFAPIAQENLVLHLVLTESDIAYNWQGQTHLNFVNRMMYPTWLGTPIHLANTPNGRIDYVLSMATDASWVIANCELVPFIQDLDTKEIIQANKIKLIDMISPPVANDDAAVIPVGTRLTGNYPNPFNPQTTISYSLKEASALRIDIYNPKGQRVKTLVNEAKGSGKHTITWQGDDDNGRPVASGLYYYKMTADKYSSTKRMILIK